MSNEISNEAEQLLAETIGMYMSEGCDYEGQPLKYDPEVLFKTYIANLEAENRSAKTEVATLVTEIAALKADAAKYEWQEGHPEHENDVLICTKNKYGKRFYTTNRWINGEFWDNLYHGKFIAWCEIRKYEKGE